MFRGGLVLCMAFSILSEQLWCLTQYGVGQTQVFCPFICYEEACGGNTHMIIKFKGCNLGLLQEHNWLSASECLVTLFPFF